MKVVNRLRLENLKTRTISILCDASSNQNQRLAFVSKNHNVNLHLNLFSKHARQLSEFLVRHCNVICTVQVYHSELL